MGKHNETGLKGEQIAIKHLLNLGYKILHTNWRFKQKEVDCIVSKGQRLIVVEVKTRTSFEFGFPEEAVDHNKKKYLKAAAEAYSEQYPGFEELQFDIVSILLTNGEVKELLHIEDAFY